MPHNVQWIAPHFRARLMPGFFAQVLLRTGYAARICHVCCPIDDGEARLHVDFRTARAFERLPTRARRSWHDPAKDLRISRDVQSY